MTSGASAHQTMASRSSAYIISSIQDDILLLVTDIDTTPRGIRTLQVKDSALVFSLVSFPQTGIVKTDHRGGYSERQRGTD